MDDLLREFLEETSESLDVVDVELVKFEQEPNNTKILDYIFRLVHTIKGTCGFLGLPRLESLAHAAETLMGKFRDGQKVTPDAVTLILHSIDRIKEILLGLEKLQTEPEGCDDDLISRLEVMSGLRDVEDIIGESIGNMGTLGAPAETDKQETEAPIEIFQSIERELKPGEISLDELEAAFQNAPGLEGFDAETSAKETAEEAAKAARAESKFPKSKPSKPMKTEKTKEIPPEVPVVEKASVSSQSIRVNVETLEHLMTMVSELVLTRNQLLEIVRRHEDSEFKVPLQRLSNVTAELQEGVMKTRMQPIGNAWQKLPRIIRDLSQDLDKKIELVMNGQDTELDRQVLEMIKDPLTHMVRNSADHGLEVPAERKALGKPEKGTVTLSAYHEGGHIIISIADDGRGLNTARISEKAIEKGLASEDEIEKMTEQQINKFIFAAGFSTAEKVTNVSGRGVGMDVVRNNIEVIGGTVDVKSVQGEGSTFVIKIPLTLAIVSTLIVEAAGDRFAIPQLSVVELVRVQTNSEHRIERIKDTPVLRLRDKLLPLIHMRQLLNIEPLDGETDPSVIANDNGFIIVMQVGSQTFGVVVDGVFHTEEIVVKPMSSMLRHLSMFSGNTILGDGSVIMILDPNGVAQAIGSHVGADMNEKRNEEVGDKNIDKKTVSLLLFRAGTAEPKAVPLSLVTRLEEFDISQIETSNGRELVQYRGALMPLVYVNEYTSRKEEGTQPMLVFSDSGRSMGLVVDEIVDIVEDSLDIEVSADLPGLLGTAVVKGKATEIIDIGYFLPQAFEDWFHRKELSEDALTKRLIFVDDSAFFRNMIGPVLKAAGYRVTVCSEASKVVELLEENPNRWDLVVSDIEMPEMNGFDLCEAIRRNPATRDMPVIALSSLCTPAAVERGRQAGFSDYVAKFDRPGLIAALKEQTIEMGMAA
ncbi:MAG: chemotaxis protein CheW [Cohaesibacteraceae bacterium]|nr:chemotaxis protein CheW [Cohaesibacteraceae bacterium]